MNGSHERALWFGVVGAPVAWTLDLIASFVAEKSFCTAAPNGLIPFPGLTLWLTLIGAVTFALGIAAGATAWRMRAVFRDAGDKVDPGADRRHFMANAGVAITAIFVFAIVLRWAAALLVPATFCTLTG